MKKTYIKPSVEGDGMEPETIICNSVISAMGIGYGGVDEDGTKDPASRRQWDAWGNEEEELY